MRPLTKVLTAVLLFAAPAGLGAAPASFEIAIFEEDFMDLGLPQTAEAAWPELMKLRDRPPVFTIRAEDVESYLWQTQRVTLTRDVTARLSARFRQSPEKPMDDLSFRWDLHDHAFLVRLDGEVLYGGLLVNPDSAKAVGYPVIHPEWIDGQAIFYLLPIHMYPGRAGDFEETDGSSRWFVRSYRQDLDPYAGDEEPEVIRFRRMLRDHRVRELFEALGKLVPAPVPPRTPAEIRTALLQTDETVDSAFAQSVSGLIAELLAPSYRQVPPIGPWLSREGIIERMMSGSWKLPFYVTLARDEPILTDNRKATLRSLVAVRGSIGGGEIDRIVLATRRYEFTGDRWILMDESHRYCGDDSPARRGTNSNDWRFQPCWPPVGPPEIDPRLDVKIDTSLNSSRNRRVSNELANPRLRLR